jgi:hypothetical protein
VLVFVVVAQVPHHIGDTALGPAPVVGDTGDAAQRVSEVGGRGVHLTDDRVLGALDA